MMEKEKYSQRCNGAVREAIVEMMCLRALSICVSLASLPTLLWIRLVHCHRLFTFLLTANERFAVGAELIEAAFTIAGFGLPNNEMRKWPDAMV